MAAIDLLIPQAFLPIDSLHYLRYITHSYPDIFLDNPKGVYKLGRIDPVLTDGQYYYTKSGLEQNKPIENISNVFEAVYNASGKCVINALTMRNQKKYLSNQSQYSYYGIMAIHYYVNMLIESHSAYISHRRYTDKFMSCFKPQYRSDILTQDINVELMLEPLWAYLYPFIANHEWTIFLTKQLGTMCLVEKTIDYRIYDWTLQKEKEEQIRLENESESCRLSLHRIIKY